MPNFNDMPDAAARAALVQCCGSSRWVQAMLARRPFADTAAVFAAADEIDRTLTRTDWLEAFAAHPKIGDLASLRTKFATTAHLTSHEQQGVQQAAEATLLGLAEGNAAYEDRFGHIFIVCATGKTADEMLAMLRARLPNDAETELRIAAGEQAKITRLRLEKLLS